MEEEGKLYYLFLFEIDRLFVGKTFVSCEVHWNDPSFCLVSKNFWFAYVSHIHTHSLSRTYKHKLSLFLFKVWPKQQFFFCFIKTCNHSIQKWVNRPPKNSSIVLRKMLLSIKRHPLLNYLFATVKNAFQLSVNNFQSVFQLLLLKNRWFYITFFCVII